MFVEPINCLNCILLNLYKLIPMYSLLCSLLDIFIIEAIDCIKVSLL